MIGSTGSVGSNILSAYATTSQSLSDALTRISTGKKFQNASEDLLGFIRSQNVQGDINGYEEVRQNLTEFKIFTSAAVDAASTLYEKMSQMRDLTTQYTGAAGDADKQAEYTSEFNALRTEVTSILTNTRVDGINVTSFSAVVADPPLKAVNLDPQGTGTLNFKFTSNTDTTAVGALVITGGAAVQTEIDKVLTYMSQAKAFDGITDQQLKLTNSIINSKQAVLSLITDIDDAGEMNKVLDLTVRQQAAISMMAQGNMAKNSLLKLYE